jgi:HAE1 family hydrophobic/amphiphilic exporter-1
MLPVALQLFRGEMFRSSMSIAVMGGLITSTALTLVIVPAVFTLVDDVERWIGPRVSKVLISHEPRTPTAAKVPPHAVS